MDQKLLTLEDKRSIEEQMYGYLPYWELFSNHQGDYLNKDDWIKIVSTIEDNMIKKVSLVFDEYEASTFCSCYEGDLYDKYKQGVNEFIKRLDKKKNGRNYKNNN
jgi:hypothetical protein